MELKFVDKIPDRIDELLENEYLEYEVQKGVESRFKRFYILTEEDENIVGVLTGYAIFSEVCVDELLVVQEYRKRGIGRSLLLCLESYCRGKDFTNINLVTNEFQAPEFYKKCGIEFFQKD